MKPPADFHGEVVQRGEERYLVPAGAPPLDGLRVVRPGLWLGSALKGRFEPSHSLAMALTADEAEQALVFTPDDPEVAAFLRGETFRSPGPDGWVLVTVDGYPLGWGKRTGEVVKNHLPKGLRRR